MAPNRPKSWVAEHRIRCPYCGQCYTQTWRSTISQEDADKNAEETLKRVREAAVSKAEIKPDIRYHDDLDNLGE